MTIAIASLKSASPYSQSKMYRTEKLPKETSANYEIRTWRDRCHTTDSGEIFIPPMQFKNCLASAAQYSSTVIPGKGKATYTKHFKAGVVVEKPLLLGIQKEDVKGEWVPVPSDGVAGGGKRVDKCFPLIEEWSGDVEFHILDATITEDIFKYMLTQAGSFQGIGRFRPINGGMYGRFTVEKVVWKA